MGVIVLVCLGCQGAALSSNSPAQQVESLASEARRLRVQAVGQRLGAAYQEKMIRVSVLDSNEIAAYGWRDGRILLTSGLIDQVNDDELAAAAAHELGHLLDDGIVKPVASLRGCKEDLDAEARADALGVQVLGQQRIAPEAMESMLAKVRDSVPADCAQGIGRRLARLAARRSALAASGRG